MDIAMMDEMNEKYIALSKYLTSTFASYKHKRLEKEITWLQSQNQYNGKHESKVLSRIPPGKSRYYDKATTAKVDQFKARATELVLPNGDKNFALYPTPVPNLPKKVLGEILAKLKLKETETQTKLIVDDIDRAVKEVAQQRAEKLEKIILDQLLEGGYSENISKSILSAAVFGSAVMKGPFNLTKKVSSYKEDELGNWSVVNKDVDKPYFEYVSVWDFFPDFDSKIFGKDDGAFFRHTMSKSELLKLRNREDFIKKNISMYVEDHSSGNFQTESYENELYSKGDENNITRTTNKYRIVEYWGSVPYSKVKDIFTELDEDTEEVEINCWMVDDVIIKCILNPFESQRRPYHVFNYKTTDTQLLGISLCEMLWEDQIALSTVGRAIYNQMAFLAEPVIQIKDDLVSKGQKINAIYPGMIIHTDSAGGTLSTNEQVLQTYFFNSNLPELQSMAKKHRENMDDISNLSAISQGDISGQATAGRTSSGIAALLGASNITLREFARNFDFFNQSIISSIVEWNMIYNDDDSFKGDFDVFSRVSGALIEKQLNANKLNELVVTMRPEEAKFANWESIFDSRLRANGLDPDLVKLSEQQVKENDRVAQEQQAQAQQQAMAMEQAKIDLENRKLDLEQQRIANETMVAQSSMDKVELDRLKTVSEVENKRTNNDLKDLQFKNQLLKDEEANNLSRGNINEVVNDVNQLNPNFTPGV